MNLAQAKSITGGLSNPSKMPGYSYNLPTKYCRLGSIMSKVEGSVCSKCYAKKGRYQFPNVQDALQRRYDSLSNPKWVEAMTVLINHYCKDVPYFRFHDSGDLQGCAHLHKIVSVCRNLPHIKFWLPTIEWNIVKNYSDWVIVPMKMPDNLNIRFSYPITDHIRKYSANSFIAEFTHSAVSTKTDTMPSHIVCPATSGKQKGCQDCRKCWDREQQLVIYAKH